MEYRLLGRTGIRVSPLCLGTMMFGPLGNPDHEECVRVVHRALDGGINFIDTADVYSVGESETIVGKAIADRRDEVVLATKFSVPMSQAPNQRGGSRKWVVEAVENSLRRLGTDYIDLYQIHRYDPDTALDELLFTLTDLVRQGKIRAFGSSMFPADRIVEAHWTAEKRALLNFSSEQSGYSIFSRDIERFVLPTCHRYGTGVMVFSPLDGGMLSGKYRGPQDFNDESRFVRHAKLWGSSFDPQSDLMRRKLEIVGELADLADQAGITLAQMAVAFILEHPAISSAIVGSHSPAQLDAILPAMEIRLPVDVLDRIDQLVPPGVSLGEIVDTPSGLDPTLRRRGR